MLGIKNGYKGEIDLWVLKSKEVRAYKIIQAWMIKKIIKINITGNSQDMSNCMIEQWRRMKEWRN